MEHDNKILISEYITVFLLYFIIFALVLLISLSDNAEKRQGKQELQNKELKI